VETSQCIVDALYGALGMLAASQGTMNNLTFGDQRLQYYETIAGGAGAGPGFAGCDAVQTHMTNSRLTDPEILEARFPVLLREFSIRRGSGGAGRYAGGNGSVRRIEFRAPLSGALLANHRRIAPFGLDGGAPGEVGKGRLLRAAGGTEEIGATASFNVEAGDVLTILTPGGGGFGDPDGPSGDSGAGHDRDSGAARVSTVATAGAPDDSGFGGTDTQGGHSIAVRVSTVAVAEVRGGGGCDEPGAQGGGSSAARVSVVAAGAPGAGFGDPDGPGGRLI
jgi:5-oxoprolinase (ATP-hydrolysing)